MYAVCGDCGWPRIYVAGAGRSSRRHSPVPIGIFVDADGRTRISAPSGAERPQSYSATEDNLIAGGKIYLNECAGCHGAPGKPNEPDSLNPAGPRLAQIGTTYSEAQIFWVAKHGIRRTGMFANGMRFRSEAVDSSGLHPSHKEPAAAGKAGNRQGSTRRQLDHVQVSAAKHALLSIQR